MAAVRSRFKWRLSPTRGSAPWLARRAITRPQIPYPLWEASASPGSARGVFDACYRYGNRQGDEGHLLGTAQERGAELTRVLKELTRGDVETMKYGTDRFFLQLPIELPRKQSPFTLPLGPRRPGRFGGSTGPSLARSGDGPPQGDLPP